ncbi:MAG TPA: response regulator [Terriglobia bacterium]|nr:response regulator [Terriglobia bacterium]
MSTEKESPKERLAALIVDDDPVFRTRLARALRERGWEATAAERPEDAVELAVKISPDLVLLDLRMPDIDGLSLIEGVKKADSTIAVIMLTGYGSIATAMQALKLGADHYLTKPVDADQIVSAYEDLQRDAPTPAAPATVPSLARVEWEHIQRVLADCSGNVSQAAKLLGIHRRSLQRKLAKYPPGR